MTTVRKVLVVYQMPVLDETETQVTFGTYIFSSVNEVM